MNRALLDLQLLDSAIADAARAKARLDTGKTARQTLGELEAKLEQSRQQAETIAQTRSKAEADLQTTETKIERQKQRMMTVSSAHEISALERDIAGLSRMRGELDETILTAMDQGETLSGELARQTKAVAAARLQAQDIEAHCAAESARLDKIVAQKKAARPAVIEQLSADDKTRYAEGYKQHGGVAVASIEGGNCSACGAEILPFTRQEAKTEEFPTCEGCGRLLWVE